MDRQGNWWQCVYCQSANEETRDCLSCGAARPADTFTTVGDVIANELSAASYGLSLRSLVRSLWRSEITDADFIVQAQTIIYQKLDGAWNAGAAHCGFNPDERSDAEERTLRTIIADQYDHLQQFAFTIEINNKASGGKLGPLLDRAALWVNRWNETKAQAQVMACADQKLEWYLGRTEEHCDTCLKMAGKVKRASLWAASKIRPQGSELDCGGWRCDCGLRVTDKPLSKGRLPG